MHLIACLNMVVLVIICLAFHSTAAENVTTTVSMMSAQPGNASVTAQTGAWTSAAVVGNGSTTSSTSATSANSNTTAARSAGEPTSIIMPLMIIGGVVTSYFNL